MRTVLPVSSRSMRHSFVRCGDRHLGEERIGLPLRAQADEPQPGPARVVLGLPVAPTVDPVPGGGPGDDRLLGIERVQVGPGLPVPVPELLAGDGTPHRPPDGAGHHHGVGQVEPHDGVGPLPDDLPHDRVVAVHDPRRRLGRLAPTRALNVSSSSGSHPGWWKMRVELDVRRAQSGPASGPASSCPIPSTRRRRPVRCQRSCSVGLIRISLTATRRGWVTA